MISKHMISTEEASLLGVLKFEFDSLYVSTEMVQSKNFKEPPLDGLLLEACPRGTPEKRPMRDTSKPANRIRQDKVVITQEHASRQRKTSQGLAMIGYTDSTWAEDMAPQGCDQSADPAAGMRGRREPPARHSGGKALNPGSARAEPSQSSSFQR